MIYLFLPIVSTWAVHRHTKFRFHLWLQCLPLISCREVCADRMMNHHAGQIGGPGMTVETESKFGKTKFNRGRYIEGQWVYGSICRQRDKDKLLPIIRARVLPGTCVMSDMWKAYDCLKDEGYTQLQPKLRTPIHRSAHTAHWKYMVGSQTKYASYRDIQRSLRKLPTGMVVASALWRRSFWKHNQAYLLFNTQCHCSLSALNHWLQS